MKIAKFGLLSLLIVGLSSFVITQTQQPSENLPVDKEMYKKFIAKFKSTQLPYSITNDRITDRSEFYNRNSSRGFNPDLNLGREFKAILPDIGRGMMSRMGPDDFEADVLVASNKRFDAIIYRQIPAFREGPRHYIATFSKKGELISKKRISYSYYDNLQDATIDKDLVITSTEYELDRSKDKDEKVSYLVKSSKTYAIQPNGNILETTVKSKKTTPKLVEGDLGAAY